MTECPGCHGAVRRNVLACGHLRAGAYREEREDFVFYHCVPCGLFFLEAASLLPLQNAIDRHRQIAAAQFAKHAR